MTSPGSPVVDLATHGIALAPGQPVVALDFDGVLNITAVGELPEGFARHVVRLDPSTWPRHRYIRPLIGSTLHGLVVNPEHGAAVRQWQAAGAAVVWATTWERAVLPVAHLAEVPELPVLEMSRIVTEPLPLRTADWKVAAIQAAFAGHPVAWVDDFGDDLAGESTFGDPPAPWLVVAPDETVGLTVEQATEVREFVARHRPAG